MDAKALLNGFLKEKYMMQLATVKDGRPWCCTVYFVSDAQHHLYWASLPSRRHSQEIEQNARVAAAIPVKHSKGESVIGIQMSGSAKQLETVSLDRLVVEAYATKFNRGSQWVDDCLAGQTEHKLYKLTPDAIVLFDEEHFPDEPRVSIL